MCGRFQHLLIEFDHNYFWVIGATVIVIIDSKTENCTNEEENKTEKKQQQQSKRAIYVIDSLTFCSQFNLIL